MSDYEGGPIDLRVCRNCPRKVERDSREVSKEEMKVKGLGKACVGVNEFGLVAAYISPDGNSTGFIKEHSTGLALASNIGAQQAFNSCSGPIKKGFLEVVGFRGATCPALTELIGDPTSANDILDFISVLEENRF